MGSDYVPLNELDRFKYNLWNEVFMFNLRDGKNTAYATIAANEALDAFTTKIGVE